jgi:signal transduction histidine kinase
MLAGMDHGETSYPRGGLVIGAITLTVLVMVRQIGAMSENARLLEAREQDLARANRLLSRANDQLSEADRAKTAFLTTICHELQTPVTSIRGFSNLLLDHAAVDPEALEYASRIARNADSLAKLVSDLTEFSRIGRGDVSLSIEPVSLSLLASRVVDQLATVAETHRIRLDIQPQVTVKADANAVTRILTNLLANAVKFSPAGTEIGVQVVGFAGVGMLAVVDEGPGIPETDKARVFDLFFRGDRAGDALTPGMGIGLAVVRELTQRMGGTVAVENRVEGGASVSVRLPLRSPANQTDIRPSMA